MLLLSAYAVDPSGSKSCSADDPQWVRQRELLQQHHQAGGYNPGADMLKEMTLIDKAAGNHTSALNSLLMRIAVRLPQPIPMLHAHPSQPAKLPGGQLVNVALEGVTQEQLELDVATAASHIIASGQRGDQGELVGPTFCGTAPISVKNSGWTVRWVLAGTESSTNAVTDDQHSIHMLRMMRDYGTTLGLLAGALEKGHAAPITFDAYILFHLARDGEARVAGPWHQDSELEGTTVRFTISLNGGGGLGIAADATGLHGVSLLRDPLQAHMLHGSFYTKGRTPIYHRSSEREAGVHGVVLILTFRHCSLGEAARLMDEMGFRVTAA